MANITTTSAPERYLLFSVIKTPEMGVKSSYSVQYNLYENTEGQPYIEHLVECFDI